MVLATEEAENVQPVQADESDNYIKDTSGKKNMTAICYS